jgi:hypothetical protein
MKIAKFSSALLMTVLLVGIASTARATTAVPDAASTSSLLLIGMGAMGVVYRNLKRAK